jgi:tagatose 1,6-diphosphate aldolase
MKAIMKLSTGKLANMQALTNARGVIAAAAMDQRGSLQKAIAAGKGIDKAEVTDEMMSEFKLAVSKVLTPYASAILLDPIWGLGAAEARDSGAGLLLSYEESGYDNTRPGRLPNLLPDASVRRIKEMGADAVKILLYYTPFEQEPINDRKHAWVERIGAECVANDIPFFLEFVGYDPGGGDEKGLEFAKKKPEVVGGSMKEFSKGRYHVDVLKVEIPVNLTYAEGASVYGGQQAYTREQTLKHYRQVAEMAGRPFIYLSAGVSNEQYTESLRWAGEAGVNFAGVLCGRATWKEGIPVYAAQGPAALEDWLRDEGVRNIRNVNACLDAAQPWYRFYGANEAQDLAE